MIAKWPDSKRHLPRHPHPASWKRDFSVALQQRLCTEQFDKEEERSAGVTQRRLALISRRKSWTYELNMMPHSAACLHSLAARLAVFGSPAINKQSLINKKTWTALREHSEFTAWHTNAGSALIDLSSLCLETAEGQKGERRSFYMRQILLSLDRLRLAKSPQKIFNQQINTFNLTHISGKKNPLTQNLLIYHKKLEVWNFAWKFCLSAVMTHRSWGGGGLVWSVQILHSQFRLQDWYSLLSLHRRCLSFVPGSAWTCHLPLLLLHPATWKRLLISAGQQIAYLFRNTVPWKSPVFHHM